MNKLRPIFELGTLLAFILVLVACGAAALNSAGHGVMDDQAAIVEALEQLDLHCQQMAQNPDELNGCRIPRDKIRTTLRNQIKRFEVTK